MSICKFPQADWILEVKKKESRELAEGFIVEKMAGLWGYGMTDTHKVNDADGLALYFKAYLSDVEFIVEEGEDVSGVKSVKKMVD